MADLTRGYTFGATETVTNTKLHNLVDLGAVSNIVNADIASGAAIVESKIAFDGSTVVLLGGAQTITGDKTFSGANTFGGDNALSGENTFSGKNIFSDVLDITGNFRMGTPVAGDVLYDNGTNIVRLTKDAGKFLRSTSTGVEWASYIPKTGATLTLSGGTTQPTFVAVGDATSITTTQTCTLLCWLTVEHSNLQNGIDYFQVKYGASALATSGGHTVLSGKRYNATLLGRVASVAAGTHSIQAYVRTNNFYMCTVHSGQLLVMAVPE